jgi:hypothetical protein
MPGDPSNCPICRAQGSTWCSHPNSVPPKNQQMSRRSVPQQSSAAGTHGDSWTPELAASLLKAALYVGVAAATWLVMRYSTAGPAAPEMPESELDEPNSEDYSSWEPKV